MSGTESLLGGVAPAAPGGETREWLPEEYRADPTFADFKDIGGLTKSYKHAASMIGVDRADLMRLPKDEAAPEWKDVWDRLGRPGKPEEYGLKGPDGLPPEVLTAFSVALHEAGLNKRQAERIMGFYSDNVLAGETRRTEASAAERVETEAHLRKTWGKAYDEQLNAAQRALDEIGGPEMSAMLKAKGLTNDPTVIQMFAKLGMQRAEPNGLKGGSGGAGFSGTLTPASAQAEIAQLSSDKAFFATLSDRSSGGYKSAKERWDTLHSMAFPA